MLKMKKLTSLALVAAITATMFSTVAGKSSDKVLAEELTTATITLSDGTVVDSNKVPKQLNVHIGDDSSTAVNFTYTTIAESATKVVLNKVGDTEKLTFDGTNSIGSANKYFHGIPVTGLKPNTNYEYTVGEGVNTTSGTFKTAPVKGSKDSFKFAYLADTQVANATDAKALGATLEEVSKMKDLSFVYFAGDITNTSTDESQWELLFNNSGAFPNGGQNMFAKSSISVIQGNHDNNTMNRHINAPAQEGNIVYSYDYGPAKFIMLNLETARYDATARAKQAEMVRAKVAEAKAAGQWTVVGFHKSLYTGASHITDSDIIEARKYWAPILSELDVDMVLQGHDHVYSRGFVNAEGENANPTKNSNGKVEDPKNAPLYMVGGHAGGLKWYSRKNYTVGQGDPLALNYSFLDVNSTDLQSDVKKEQYIVEMEISNKEFSINTYAFKYDTATDTITTEKYLYDTMTCIRNVASADITGSNLGVADTNQEVNYTVSMTDIKNTNAFNTAIAYDANVMEFVKAESLLDGTIFSDIKNENGKASIIIGTQNLITNATSSNIAKFTFKMKTSSEAGNTNVKLIKVDSAQAVIENDKVTGAFDTVANYNTDKVTTEIYTYKKAADINGDGKITLSDLSIALANYQGTDKKCDIDLDTIINVKDYIIIANKIAA
jgi:predicted phosphodiesterase